MKRSTVGSAQPSDFQMRSLRRDLPDQLNATQPGERIVPSMEFGPRWVTAAPDTHVPADVAFANRCHCHPQWSINGAMSFRRGLLLPVVENAQRGRACLIILLSQYKHAYARIRGGIWIKMAARAGIEYRGESPNPILQSSMSVRALFSDAPRGVGRPRPQLSISSERCRPMQVDWPAVPEPRPAWMHGQWRSLGQ